jgi:cell division protein FtsW
MTHLLRHLKGDRSIWLVVILLSLISMVSVYSATSALAFRFQDGDTEYYLLRHAILLIVGLGIVYAVHRINYRFVGRISKWLLIASGVLLVITLLQGKEAAINETQRWITIFGQSFQPSDFAKFALMVYLARVLAQKQEIIKDFYRTFLPTLAPVFVICGLIAPFNLSTAVLIFFTSIVLMYVAGVKLRFLGGLMAIGLAGLMILFLTAERASTWNSRWDDFRNRFTNEQYQANYQTVQANIAIATGGLTGLGVGKSVQRNFLPHPYSDFVYAIIVEEYGLVGGLVVLLLYLWLLFRAVAIVTVSKTFGALLAAALAFLLVSQAFINMMVTVGLLPVTGLPLPFVSMGGTSILFTSVSLGLILNVSRKINEDSALQNRRSVDPSNNPSNLALG